MPPIVPPAIAPAFPELLGEGSDPACATIEGLSVPVGDVVVELGAA